MNFSYFLQGYVIGFSVATTIGISGVLCLQNMMTGRIRIALASVLAAVSVDMIFAVLIVFGLGSVQQFLYAYQKVLSMVAGLFLCGLGLQKIFQSFKLASIHKVSENAWQAFFSVFFLALVDPVSLIDFAALFMGLTLDFSLKFNAFTFVLGLGAGSFTWWIGLSGIILWVRQKISAVFFYRMQQLAGLGIFCFGLSTLLAWL